MRLRKTQQFTKWEQLKPRQQPTQHTNTRKIRNLPSTAFNTNQTTTGQLNTYWSNWEHRRRRTKLPKTTSNNNTHQ